MASGLKEPSGRPGHGRPSRWRRLCQSSRLCVRGFAPATNPCCPPQTARFRPHQRCSVLHLFEGQCLFARTVVPRSNVSASLTEWAVPAQAGEAVFPPTAAGSSAAPGSLRSPFRGAPEPAALRFKTASPATLHFVPRPMALEDLQAAPASRSEGTPAKSPAQTPPPARLPVP